MSWSEYKRSFKKNKETYLEKISSFTDKLGSINPDEKMSEAKLKAAGMSELEVKFFKFFLSRTKGSKVNDALKSAGLEEEFASLIPFLEMDGNAEKVLEQIGLRGYQLVGIKELINKVAPNGLVDEPEEDGSNKGGASQEAGSEDNKPKDANPGNDKPEDKDSDQQEEQGNANQNSDANCFTKEEAEKLFEEKYSKFFAKEQAEKFFEGFFKSFKEENSNFFRKDEDKKDFEGFYNRFQEELDNLRKGLEQDSEMSWESIQSIAYIQKKIFCEFSLHCNVEQISKHGFSGYCEEICSGD
jgi:hypothetical protein